MKRPPVFRRPDWEGVLCQAYWAVARRMGRTPLDLGLASCTYNALDAKRGQPLRSNHRRPPR